jgi:hypothetical protein
MNTQTTAGEYATLFSAATGLLESAQWAEKYLDTIVDPRALNVIASLRSAIAKATPILIDSGECESCVDGKCVTGKRCVTLGRDNCAHCRNSGYLADGNHCQWCGA